MTKETIIASYKNENHGPLILLCEGMTVLPCTGNGVEENSSFQPEHMPRDVQTNGRVVHFILQQQRVAGMVEE